MGRPRTQPDVCQAASCGEAPKARGLCDQHYYRQRYYGDPNATTRTQRCWQRACDLMWLLEQGTPAAEALPRVGWTFEAAKRWTQRNRWPELRDALGVGA